MDVSQLLQLFANFAQSNPKLSGAFAIAYMIGIGAKSIRSAIETFVQDSPSKSDDEKLAKIESGSGFKIVSSILDILLRIKKPEVK